MIGAGTILIGQPVWVVPAVGLLAVSLVLAVWSYRRAPLRGWVGAAAFGLKSLALGALALCLIEPLWAGTRARPGANLLLMLVDNSRGLQVRDTEGNSLGADFAAQLSNEQAPWQVRLEQDFEVRRYRFDERVESLTDFRELPFDGTASSLRTALETLAERFAGRPVAGIMLWSDGNATDLLDGFPAAGGLPAIFPVLPPGLGSTQDLAVTGVATTQSNFEDAPVAVKVDVEAQGYAGRQLVCQLLDQDGNVVNKQSQTVSGQPLGFRFQLRPKQPGVSFYQVRISAHDELDQFDEPQRSLEATLANNSRLLCVNRGRGPYHVLYVCGRPNWEFKFLRRALDEDEEVRLVGMIRIAKREPKFDFRSRTGESTNPLFRGFGNDGDEEAERYDQPVIVRLNTRDDAELRDGFPKSREELFAYHAIILDDVEAEFFNRDQMSLVEQFVAERGGGLLMLGGSESFRQGEFRRTPIGNLLPVYLDPLEPHASAMSYRLSITREGWLQPWVRLRANEADENARLEEMPHLRTLNRVRGIKPGATVMAEVTDPSGTAFPALVAQRFGKGRSAALTVGDLWRWGLRSPTGGEDLGKAWRQTVRWLVSDVPEPVELEVERPSDTASDEPAAGVRLLVRARDDRHDPLDQAVVKLTVTGPQGEPLTLDAEPSLSEPGQYEAWYVPREAGAYRIRAEVTDGDGQPRGQDEAGWTANPAADEFRSLVPNTALLEDLADRTGGQMVSLDALDEFAESLPHREVEITDPWIHPLWHHAGVLLLVVLCLSGEWGLRRYRGLP